MPRGVLVDSRAAVKHEYYAGVVWDGIRKRPVMLFSDMGGIDIEEVAEEHPDHVARGALLHPDAVPRLAGQAADRLARDHRLGPEPAHPDPRPAGPAVPPLRHDAGRDQPARRARGRLVRRARRPHGHGERGPPAPEGAAARARRRRRGDPPGARGDAVRARRRGGRRPGPPRRGRQRHRVRRQPRAGDRRRRRLADAVRRRPRPRRRPGQLLRDRRQSVGQQGLRPGQAGAPEARRRQDRGDDVDRLQHARGHRRPRRDQGVRRARLRPGREDRDLPDPGRVGGGGLQDPGAYGVEYADRSVSLHEAARRAVERIQGPPPHEHPARREHDLHRPGHHRPRGRQPDARVPGLRRAAPRSSAASPPAGSDATSTACRCSTRSRRPSSTTARRSTARS